MAGFWTRLQVEVVRSWDYQQDILSWISGLCRTCEYKSIQQWFNFCPLNGNFDRKMGTTLEAQTTAQWRHSRTRWWSDRVIAQLLLWPSQGIICAFVFKRSGLFPTITCPTDISWISLNHMTRSPLKHWWDCISPELALSYILSRRFQNRYVQLHFSWQHNHENILPAKLRRLPKAMQHNTQNGNVCIKTIKVMVLCFWNGNIHVKKWPTINVFFFFAQFDFIAEGDGTNSPLVNLE